MTYFSGSFNLGVVLATLGLGALAGSIGYRPVFVVVGVVTRSALPVLRRGLRKPSTAQPLSAAPPQPSRRP